MRPKFPIFWAAILGIGIALCVVGALSIRSIVIPVEAKFGMGNYLPILFWVGFVLVLLGSYFIGWIGQDVSRMLALLTIALIMWCTPILVVTLPLRRDSFWHISTAGWISNNGHVTFSKLGLPYLQYPAVFLLAAILGNISTAPPLAIISLYPFFVVTVFTLNFYLLSKKFLGNGRMAFLASAFAVAGNTVMFPTHFAPSATAQALFPLLIYVILRMEEHSAQRTDLSIFLILTTFYTLLHPAMPLLMALCIFALLVRHNSKKLQSALIFTTVLFFSWSAFVGNWGFSNLGRALADFVKGLIQLGERTPGAALVAHQTLLFPDVGLIKTGLFSCFLFCGLLTIVTQFRKGVRGWRKRIDKAAIMFLSILSASVLSMLATVIYARALAWVVPFSILTMIGAYRRISQSLRLKGVFLCIIILVALSTFLVSYSGEGSLITTESEHHGISFVARNIKDGDKLLMDSAATMQFFTKYSIDYVSLPFRNQSGQLSLDWLESSTVVTFRRSSYAWQYYEVEGKSYNSYTIAFNNCMHNVRFNPVYSDLDVVMFQRNGNQSGG